MRICFWLNSLRANPLARSPGQVKLDSENYERICLNKLFFLLLNLAFLVKKIKAKTTG